jgi:hypothetical protein
MSDNEKYTTTISDSVYLTLKPCQIAFDVDTVSETEGLTLSKYRALFCIL